MINASCYTKIQTCDFSAFQIHQEDRISPTHEPVKESPRLEYDKQHIIVSHVTTPMALVNHRIDCVDGIEHYAWNLLPEPVCETSLANHMGKFLG